MLRFVLSSAGHSIIEMSQNHKKCEGKGAVDNFFENFPKILQITDGKKAEFLKIEGITLTL